MKDQLRINFEVAYLVWITAQHAKAPHFELEPLWNAYCSARDEYLGIGYFSSKSPKVFMTDWGEAEA